MGVFRGSKWWQLLICALSFWYVFASNTDPLGEYEEGDLSRERNFFSFISALKHLILKLNLSRGGTYICIHPTLHKLLGLQNVLLCFCEDMIEHGSYAHNLSSCEIEARKKIQVWTGFEPMTSAIPVQCSTNWAVKPSGSWPLCEFVIYP